MHAVCYTGWSDQPAVSLPLILGHISNMKYVVAFIIIALLVLHQDIWFWNNGYLVFGFMPIGLFYHACISLAAATTWFLAVTFCWPEELAEAEREAK